MCPNNDQELNLSKISIIYLKVRIKNNLPIKLSITKELPIYIGKVKIIFFA